MEEAGTIPNMAAEGKHITDVIAAYSKRLLGFIRKRVDTVADAEDILQDVFYQFIGNTKPIEQLNGWLFTVARNKITDKQRKKHYDLLEDEFAVEDEEDLSWQEIFFDVADNPESELLKSMFWDALYAALDELPAAQREAFILHELEGIPFLVIAEQTGETVNTLLSRKRYAVLHLRKKLKVLRDEILKH
jgi:RNA polymerase sigma factor (sigma-70 family)